MKPLQTKHWLALLTTLFVIVLIAHLAIITSARGQLGINKPAFTEVFTTRMIEPPSITPASAKTTEVESPSKLSKPKAKVIYAPSITQSTPAITHDAATNTVTTPPFMDAVDHVELANPEPPVASASTPVPTTTVASPVSATDTSRLPSPASPTFEASNMGRHKYRVTFTRNGVVNQGNAEMVWQHDGEKYALNLLATYTLIFKTFNVFEQNSQGLVTPKGLQPLRFSDKRLNRSEVAAHFDYANQKITFSANKPEATLQAGAQDRISVIWQMSGLLAGQPELYPLGSSMTVQTVSASDAEPWVFNLNGYEVLPLATDSQKTLLLTRSPRREFDQKIELWFATDMNYLPVRFRFTETNGDYVDAIWQSVQAWENTVN